MQPQGRKKRYIPDPHPAELVGGHDGATTGRQHRVAKDHLSVTNVRGKAAVIRRYFPRGRHLARGVRALRAARFPRTRRREVAWEVPRCDPNVASGQVQPWRALRTREGRECAPPPLSILRSSESAAKKNPRPVGIFKC